ncbi:MAG: hypothetical protein U1F98_10455 [Verrucomicrobiota bacterium]
MILFNSSKYLLIAAGFLGLTAQLNAAPFVLLTGRNPALPLPAGGNADSTAPALTPDGRFVVFSSVANDLTAVGSAASGNNVYLYDRQTHQLSLVSATATGRAADGYSFQGRASTNCQFVLFQSTGLDLIPGNTNKRSSQIFVRDMANQSNTLVSVAMDGAPGNRDSSDPVMTPDGRFVAFSSRAYDLTPGNTNYMEWIYLRDLQTATTTWLTPGVYAGTGTGQYARRPLISCDGRWVAFFSNQQGIVPGVPTNSAGEIFVYDRILGTTTWASAAAASIVWSNFVANPTNAPPDSLATCSYHACLSDDGRRLVFKAGDTDLNGNAVILRYDLVAGTTEVVTTNAIPGTSDQDDPYGPEMSADGRYIAYACKEGTNAAALTSTMSFFTSLHVLDEWTSTDTIIGDPGTAGIISSTSKRPVFSPGEGRFVAFLSDASGLVNNPIAPGFHLYLRELSSGGLLLVDADTNGMGSVDQSLSTFEVSSDGSVVAFTSPDGGLVSRDFNQAVDVFARDVLSGSTELVSSRDPGLALATADALNSISFSAISADGRWAAFTSTSTGLAANVEPDLENVYVADLATGSLYLVSAGCGGGPALGGNSSSPIFTGNSRYLLFTSRATNLVTGFAFATNANAAPPPYLNVYRFDLLSRSSTLMTFGADKSSYANADCSDAAISQDGRYVAFLTTAYNLGPAPTNLYPTAVWRDVLTGSTIILTNIYNSTPCAPTLSMDGRYMAYQAAWASASTYWKARVFDAAISKDVHTNAYPLFSTTITGASLSPNGNYLEYSYSFGTGLYQAVDNVRTRSVVFSSGNSIIANLIGWSADGNFVAFVAATNVANGTNLFLYDLVNKTRQTVSQSADQSTGANAASDAPALSGDGRLVIYRSWASNLVAGISNPAPNLYIFDRVAGTNALLNNIQAGDAAVFWNSRPSISANASTIAFLTTGTGWAANDLNRSADAFAIELAAPTDPTDSDHDGIPDWWMNQYFGHPTGQAGDYSMAQDDADGDGVSNLAEYTTGTDPRNAGSVFHISPRVSVTNGTMTVSWAAAPGLMYRVLYKDNVGDPAWQEAPVFTWSNGQQGYFIVPSKLQNRFYRVVAGNW